MTRLDSMRVQKTSSALQGQGNQFVRILGFHAAEEHGADRTGKPTPRIAAPAADLDYEIDDGHLHIRIDGSLDLRCAFALLLIGRTVDESIDTCTLDLTGVDRIFDSGIAALVLVTQALKEKGVEQIRIHGLDIGSATLQPFLM